MTTPENATKEMIRMYPGRVDGVDRPATKRRFLLMKSADITSLEKDLDGLVASMGATEALHSVVERLQIAKADPAIIDDLQKAVTALENAQNPPDSSNMTPGEPNTGVTQAHKATAGAPIPQTDAGRPVGGVG